VSISPSTEKTARAWVLLACGIVWVSYFAFYNPSAMNPYFMTLGASALFGPSVINMWRGGGRSDERDQG
jgi:hypothetical protein